MNEARESIDAVVAFTTAWDAHDLEATLALVTEDCVFESARPDAVGPEHVRAARPERDRDPDQRPGGHHPGDGERTGLALHVQEQGETDHGDRHAGEHGHDRGQPGTGRAQRGPVVGKTGRVGHASQYAHFGTRVPVI